MAAAELGKAAAKERAAEPETITIEPAEFAFLIYKKDTGEITVSPDINVPVEVERQATSDELVAVLSKVLEDIRTQNIASLTAQAVVAQQMQLAMRAAEAQRNQQLLNTLPKGLAK